MMPNDCAMPLGEGSASQSMRSSRAPLPRWKRATGSTGAVVRVDRLGDVLRQLALEPAREGGRRRERHEVGELRQLARNLRRHLLDQEAAERDPGEAAL